MHDVTYNKWMIIYDKQCKHIIPVFEQNLALVYDKFPSHGAVPMYSSVLTTDGLLNTWIWSGIAERFFRSQEGQLIYQNYWEPAWC